MAKVVNISSNRIPRLFEKPIVMTKQKREALSAVITELDLQPNLKPGQRYKSVQRKNAVSEAVNKIGKILRGEDVKEVKHG